MDELSVQLQGAQVAVDILGPGLSSDIRSFPGEDGIGVLLVTLGPRRVPALPFQRGSLRTSPSAWGTGFPLAFSVSRNQLQCHLTEASRAPRWKQASAFLLHSCSCLFLSLQQLVTMYLFALSH